MRTDYLCGLLWVGGGRESQERKQCETEKERQKKNHFWFRKMPSFVHHTVPWKTSPPPLQHTMARLCEETVQPHKAESTHGTVQPCQHSLLHSFYSLCANSGPGLLCKPAQLPTWGRTLTSASSRQAGNSQPSWLSLSSSELTYQRIAKAATRRWLKHWTGRRKAEGKSFLYFHFLQQVIKLPLMLRELQPQSTFSKTLKTKHMQQCEAVRVLITRNRTKVVFKNIQCSLSHENCLLQSTI